MAKLRIPQVRNFYRKGKRVLSGNKRNKCISRTYGKVIVKFTRTELLIVHNLVLKEIENNPKNNVEELLNIELKTS